MKRKRFSIIIFAVVVVLVLAAAAGTLGFKSYYKASETPVSLGLSEKVDSFIMPVRLIAHRGFSGLAPENTVPAVKAAADAEELGEALGRAGVCVRAGLHCAPTAHESAGTLSTGTVRFSFSAFNTATEAMRAAAIVKSVLDREK